MEDRAQGRTPFDERAALEELDRLREQIEHYKAQRKAVEAEFDRFVGSFKTPRESAVVNRSAQEASTSETRGAPPPAPPASVPRPEWPSPQFVAPHAQARQPDERRATGVEPLVTTPEPRRAMPGPVAPEARRVPPEPTRAAPDAVAPTPEPAPALPEPLGPAPEAPPALSQSPRVPPAPEDPRRVPEPFLETRETPHAGFDRSFALAEAERAASESPPAAPEPLGAVPPHAHFAPERPHVEAPPSRDLPEPFLSASDPVLQPATDPVPTPSALPVPASPPAGSSSRRMLLPGALILLVGGGLLTWSLRRGAPESTAPQTPQPVSAPASPAPEPPPPAAPEPAPFESELTTTRAVWLRIIADGERIVEREVPAGTRVPFEARKTIVIRTGDAGAVRLSIGGQDQGFLGREGEVTTRTFAVPGTVGR